MNRLEVSAAARADLFGIRLFASGAGEDYANRVVEKFQGAFERLRTYPRLGQSRPDLALGPIRLWVETPYLIVYREIEDGVEIARVIHGSRDLRSALRDAPG